MKKIWYYLIGGFSGAVLITAIVFVVININLPNELEDGVLNNNSNEHEPIIILNDEDFGDYNFSGIGTESNPFIIENFNISTEEEHAIYISFTTKCFIIRNCILSADEIGIYIGNITDGVVNIDQNICSNLQGSGIFITGSTGISITSNICNNNSYGIITEESSYLTLFNNTCNENNWFGIYLDTSNNISLTQNTCNNNHDGIKTYHSFSAIFTNNICDNNDHRGISIESAFNITLIDNTCYDNNHGISMDFSFNLTIINNTCINNNQGIFLGVSSFTTLINNTCNNNDNGIWVDYNSNNTILTNNTLKNNVLGVWIWRCSNSSVSFNFFVDNSDFSILISSFSENNVIHHNSFIDNNFGGTSQAKDDGLNNIWYDKTTNEGNYWSDWIGTGDYDIDGTANIVDLYPLISPPIT